MVSNIAEVKSFLAMSLRLPLLQFVLAVGKRNGPFPPVLEIDVASVRLTREGILTVRHVSVNSWSQEVDVPIPSGAGVTMAAERGRSGCGYRVLGRSGQSEESGKDFLRMEVRVPDAQFVGPSTSGSTQPQLDVVIQVIFDGSEELLWLLPRFRQDKRKKGNTLLARFYLTVAGTDTRKLGILLTCYITEAGVVVISSRLCRRALA